METTELHYLPIAEVAERLYRHKLSPVDLVQHSLARVDALDPKLHSYLTVLGERALAEAKLAQEEIYAGKYRGPLHGVPVGIKDLCAVRNVPMSCGSRILADNIPAHDSTVVHRLTAAGAIVIGKLNMTEFAATGYHPDYPAPLNPWDLGRWPGLSSSGSGAATAAGLCYAATGTDTGGSIRLPSASCGVVGIKPTFGRVSRHGVVPLSQSLDHVGPMARTVRDAAIMLGVMAGADPEDATSTQRPVDDYMSALAHGIEGLRIGYDESYATNGVADDVVEAIEEALKVLTTRGAVIVPIQIGSLASVMDAALTIFLADIASAHRDYWPQRADEYGVAMRGALEAAGNLTAVDYSLAHATRLQWRGRLAQLFGEVDALLCPSLAQAAPLLGDRRDEMELVSSSAQFTIPFNVGGHPTISVPCGFSTEGLPLSLQLIGQAYDEPLLLSIAHEYERATPWHLRHPADPV